MATLNNPALKFSLALSAVYLFGASSCMPVAAMTLNGRLETNQVLSGGKDAGNGGGGSITAPLAPVAQNIAPSAAQLDPNTFPRVYQGNWACQTTVVNSSAPAVQAGQVIASEVTFYPTANGLIKARWSQAGWVETQSVASSFGKNSDEAKSDRTTYYYGDNTQGSWAARARDQFALTAPDTIEAKSYVDQYIDGQYVGRYRTVSILKRTSTDTPIAEAN